MKSGERIGPYLLRERLGRGGFAEVWRATPDLSWVLEQGSPAERVAVLRVLTKLLALQADDGARRTGRLLGGLLETAELLSPGAERKPVEAPEAVRSAHEALVEETIAWAGSLGEAGQLDLALKVPFHDGYVRQLRREEDVLERVKHANLVEQFQLEVVHDPPFLAMELVEGWSLRDALKQEPLPPLKKILAVMDQLLAVLDHLHARNIVHGDVKPENILLEPDGTLRLIDLGLGRVSQAVMRDAYLSLSLASRVPLMGTLSYMAPEVRRGEPAGPRADLYSAGIVLYEMLVGDVPSGMMMPSEAAPQRALTERFDILLKWVLHPEPARRVPTGAELRERVLITLRPRDRHQLGTGRTGKGRDGTLAFDVDTLDQASPFIQGDWVGPFQLEEPLGRGGFGEVWRARRGEGRRDELALKLAIGPHGREALEKEADVAGLLDHPLIPSVQERDVDHDPPYLAVDFVRGTSLRARLNERGPIPVDEALPLIASLVEALAHCHARGVVHRDLKPENLLLDEASGHLHLLDFGLASTGHLPIERPRAELSDTLDTTDLEGGTYEYMAPERRRGEAGGPATDLYSVGVILFELLTGELPRGLTKLSELCGARRSVEALTERLLHPSPGARPSPEEVLTALRRERPRRGILFGRRADESGSGLAYLALNVAGVFFALLGLGFILWSWVGDPSAKAAVDPRELAGRDLDRLDQATGAQACSLPINELEEAITRHAAELARLQPLKPQDPRLTVIDWRLKRLRAWASARHASLELGTDADYAFGKLRAGLLPEVKVEPMRSLATDQLLGRIERDLRRALELDPLSPKLLRWGPLLLDVRREREALAARAQNLAKEHPLVPHLLGSPAVTAEASPPTWPPWLTGWVEGSLRHRTPSAVTRVVSVLGRHLPALAEPERARVKQILETHRVRAAQAAQRAARLSALLDLAERPEAQVRDVQRALSEAASLRPGPVEKARLRVAAARVQAHGCTTTAERVDQAWSLLWLELRPDAARAFTRVAHAADPSKPLTLLAAAAQSLSGDRSRAEALLETLPASFVGRLALRDRIQDFDWRHAMVDQDEKSMQVSATQWGGRFDQELRDDFRKQLEARIELERAGLRLRESVLTLR